MKPLTTTPPLLTDPLPAMLEGCRQQDIQCQEQLYRHCYPAMIRVCLRYAGDMDGAGIIFNNAMLRVFKNMPGYNEQGRFMGWVKTIVINCCLDFIRQQHKFRETSLTAAEEEIQIPADILNRVSVKEIQQVIQELPKATAVAFNLFVYEGFTHKQISQALGISEGTSKWQVNEARRILKSRLESFLNY